MLFCSNARGLGACLRACLCSSGLARVSGSAAWRSKRGRIALLAAIDSPRRTHHVAAEFATLATGKPWTVCGQTADLPRLDPTRSPLGTEGRRGHSLSPLDAVIGKLQCGVRAARGPSTSWLRQKPRRIIAGSSHLLGRSASREPLAVLAARKRGDADRARRNRVCASAR